MILADNGSALVHLGRQQPALQRRRPARARARSRAPDFEVVDTSRPAQRLRARGTLPRTGDTGDPRRESTMRPWATSRSLRPPCASPSSFCLTYFLCVGPRRALALDARRRGAAGRDRDLARHGRRRAAPAGRRASGRQDAAPVVWWLALAWLARGRRRAPPSAPGATASAARYEVSSNRRAARRLSRRASHQAPPARSRNGPPTMAAKSAPRPATEITPRASSAVRSNAPV